MASRGWTTLKTNNYQQSSSRKHIDNDDNEPRTKSRKEATFNKKALLEKIRNMKKQLPPEEAANKRQEMTNTKTTSIRGSKKLSYSLNVRRHHLAAEAEQRRRRKLEEEASKIVFSDDDEDEDNNNQDNKTSTAIDYLLAMVEEDISATTVPEIVPLETPRELLAAPKRNIYQIEDDDGDDWSFKKRRQTTSVQLSKSIFDFVGDDDDSGGGATKANDDEDSDDDFDVCAKPKENLFFKSKDQNHDSRMELNIFKDSSRSDSDNFTAPQVSNTLAEDETAETERSKAAAKRSTKAKSSVGNYKRLNIKKKFGRNSNRNFNVVRKAKFQSWRTSKQRAKYSDNKCFECGLAGHMAAACPNVFDASAVNNDEQLEGEAGQAFLAQFNMPNSSNSCRPLFTSPTDAAIEPLLHKCLTDFGLSDFRPNQQETIARVLSGRSTLLIAPTGSGKSLTYQMAAYAYWQRQRTFALIVSPLISLMQDQLANAPSGLRVASYNSSQSEAEKKSVVNSLLSRGVACLFISPECLVAGQQPPVPDFFDRISFVCIDEAHCLVEWSTNFRPAYLHVFKVLEQRIGRRLTVLGLTATATKDVQQMICHNLGMDMEGDVLGRTSVPANHRLAVTLTTENEKMNKLVALLQAEPFKSCRSIVVYATRREQTEKLESYIRTSMQFNKDIGEVNKLVRAYHAGLSANDRRHIQQRFVAGKLRIIVATIAFGLGINNGHIDGVIHFNMPKSFDNYLQEIGRAGRLGQAAYCHLLLDTNCDELYQLQKFIYANGMDRWSLRRLVRKIYQPCKCRLLSNLGDDNDDCEPMETQDDDGSARTSKTTTTCHGHQVAIPIVEEEVELDLRSETIYTLLLYLATNRVLDHVPPIELLPSGNDLCTITCYDEGNSAAMKKLMASNELLELALMTAPKVKGKSDESQFTFSLSLVGRLKNLSVTELRARYRQLEWKEPKAPGERWKRTNQTVRFSGYAYNLKSVGTLSDADIEAITEHLVQLVNGHEALEVQSLRQVYSTFRAHALPTNADEASRKSNSDQMKQFLNDYFNARPTPKPMELEMMNLPAQFINNTGYDLGSITGDIFECIQAHYEEGLNTARKVARVLQGISSPKFPAIIWGMVRRHWRSYEKIDFQYLMELCQKQLQLSYSVRHGNDKKDGQHNKRVVAK